MPIKTLELNILLYFHKSAPIHQEQESVEIHIPIHIQTTPETHRNEKHIFIGKDCSGNDTAFDTMRHNMRRYIDERLNKFEAEITFYNLSDNANTSSSNSSCSSVLSCSPRHHHHLHHHHNVLTFRQTEPASCVCHYHLLNGCPAGCCSLLNHKSKSRNFRQKFQQNLQDNGRSEASVTNLMLMQIVNGRLIE